jgi:hypothetical protein
MAQAHFCARTEAVEFFRWVLHEVGPFDPDFTGERDRSGSFMTDVVWPIVGLQLLDFSIFEVGEHHFDRIEHTHHARRLGIQVVANRIFEQSHIDPVVSFGHSNQFTEAANGRSRITTASHARERGHARIVPALNATILDQGEQLTLAHNGVVQVQSG